MLLSAVSVKFSDVSLHALTAIPAIDCAPV